MHNKPGYILILTLMILSLATLLVTNLFYQATSQVFFNHAMITREKARQLVTGGIQVAMSRIVLPTSEPSAETAKDKKDAVKEQFKQLIHLFPQLYTPQEFPLKEKTEGIDATLSILIASEQGKININSLYNFKDKKFKKNEDADAAKYLADICERIERIANGKDLFKGLEKFLKSREGDLEDVTELLLIPEFQKAFGNNIFYKHEPDAKKKNIFLTDIFTVFYPQHKINLIAFSNSLALLFNLRGPASWSEREKQEIVDGVINDKNPPSTSKERWDKYLKKAYGKDFSAFPKVVVPFLEFDLKANLFSVTIWAIINNISQRAMAILEQKISNDKKPPAWGTLRFYWI